MNTATDQKPGASSGDGVQTPTPGAGSPGGDGAKTGTTTTPTQTVTFTKADIDAAVKRAVDPLNARLGERGRELEKLRGFEATAKTLKERLDAIEKQNDEDEMKQAQGDPGLITAWRMKQDAKKRMADAEERERKIAEREVNLNNAEPGYLQWQAERAAKPLAEQYAVNMQDILDLSPSTSAEDLEKTAKKLAERGIKIAAPGSGTTNQPKNVPESGMGTGGANISFRQSIRDQIDEAKGKAK